MEQHRSIREIVLQITVYSSIRVLYRLLIQFKKKKNHTKYKKKHKSIVR